MAGFAVFFLLWLVIVSLTAWAVIDAALVPDSAWQRIDQNKVIWILVAAFIPIAGPLAYLLAIRPKVRAGTGV